MPSGSDPQVNENANLSKVETINRASPIFRQAYKNPGKLPDNNRIVELLAIHLNPIISESDKIDPENSIMACMSKFKNDELQVPDVNASPQNYLNARVFASRFQNINIFSVVIDLPFTTKSYLQSNQLEILHHSVWISDDSYFRDL